MTVRGRGTDRHDLASRSNDRWMHDERRRPGTSRRRLLVQALDVLRWNATDGVGIDSAPVDVEPVSFQRPGVDGEQDRLLGVAGAHLAGARRGPGEVERVVRRSSASTGRPSSPQTGQAPFVVYPWSSQARITPGRRGGSKNCLWSHRSRDTDRLPLHHPDPTG